MLFFVFIQLCCLLVSPIIADEGPCDSGFRQCAPVGASRRGVPVIGPDLARFYLELVYTVQSIPDNHAPEQAGSPGIVARQEIEGDSLCCAEAAACDLIGSFRIAFCWDRFTTSYFLPDGSYGSANNGSYTTPRGDTANLITGEYQMKDGTYGNIYNDSPADKPDTTSLPIPTPWTSSGVGAAIPASRLGAQDTTVTPWLTTATSSSDLLSFSTESVGSTSIPSRSSAAPSSTPTIISSLSSSSTISNSSITGSSATQTTAIDSVTSLTTSFGDMHNSTTSAPSGSTATGTPRASGSSTNVSSPIIPPITNLATAAAVYCMAVKVLAWAVAAVTVA